MGGWNVGPWIILIPLGFLCATGWTGCSSGSKEDVLAVVDGEAQEAAREYQKPEGVVLHVRAILGMKYSEFAGSSRETHLGRREAERKLPGVRGRAITYEVGELLVARDTIYGVSYAFPEAVDIIGAIHAMGLPESLRAEFKPTALEVRAERSAYGFRRLVLTRSAPWEERFTLFRAWKYLPQEKY